MGHSTQIAFQLDDESLAQVDRLVGTEFSSRAGVIRAAVQAWLAERREREIDAQLEAGYAAVPQGPEVRAFAEISIRGLAAADLDW
jgi:Arc/MetJ-type ribon-helix-helix transcriptional regulator